MKDIGTAIAWILLALFVSLIFFITYSEPGQYSLWTKLMELSHHWINIELQR